MVLGGGALMMTTEGEVPLASARLRLSGAGHCLVEGGQPWEQPTAFQEVVEAGAGAWMKTGWARFP